MPWNDPNALLGIGGIVVGLVGIIISVLLYFRSKNKKILEYKINSTQLITESMTSIPNLKVIIDDQPVETLVSTTIEFINSGNQSMVSSDFAIKEPLGISITGHLHSYDVFTDNPNSLPSLKPISNKDFCIEFDFLKEKQTFSITLLHSGNVNVLGELKTGIIRERRKGFALPWLITFMVGILSGCISNFLAPYVTTHIQDLLDIIYVTSETVVSLLILVLLVTIIFLIRKVKNKKD